MAKNSKASTPRRTDLPVALPGATSYSDDRDVLSPLTVVQLLKQHPDILGDLLEATTIVHEGRKKRLSGSWALSFVHFVCSGYPDIEPWWRDSKDTKLWEECGFTKRPPYQTAYERLVELEAYELAFRQAAWKLVRRARKHTGGIVGRDLHIDCTEAETNARFIHDCRPGECPYHGKKKRPGELPERVTSDVVRKLRQDAAEKAPEFDKLVLGEGSKLRIEIDPATGREVVRFQAKNGCWYRSLDVSAGCRAYTGSHGATRFWDGFYNAKTVDHYTGVPIDVRVFNASYNEFSAYPMLLGGMLKALEGEIPRAVVADKGFSIETVYEQNTRLGITTVAPFRRGRFNDRGRYDTEEYDRHGIPRCKHCGGEGRFVSFTLSPKPRLLYACARGCPDSPARMSINCEKKWRLLLPLWRDTEAYMALRDSHSEYEGTHRYWRQRYTVAGTNFYTRPKRIGAAWQQLRASAALLVDWLKVSWREGWLGSPRRNRNQPKVRDGSAAVQKLRDYRLKLCLDRESAGQEWRDLIDKDDGPPLEVLAPPDSDIPF